MEGNTPCQRPNPLLKFPGKGKIFQKKKSITSYTSHQLTYHDENWCEENWW